MEAAFALQFSLSTDYYYIKAQVFYSLHSAYHCFQIKVHGIHGLFDSTHKEMIKFHTMSILMTSNSQTFDEARIDKGKTLLLVICLIFLIAPFNLFKVLLTGNLS